MKEQAINITPVSNEKIGKSKAEDFVIKFNPILKLENDIKHEIAMDKVSTTYSWHNISDQCIIEKVFLQLCKNGQSNLILCFFLCGQHQT